MTCHASRGYPEANVLWQDGQGSNITENITTSQVANEEGLFDVHSVLQVLVEPSSTYSCVVRNPVLQQETQASVTITGEPVGPKLGKGSDGHCLKKVTVVALGSLLGLLPHISARPLSPWTCKGDLRLCCPPCHPTPASQLEPASLVLSLSLC